MFSRRCGPLVDRNHRSAEHLLAISGCTPQASPTHRFKRPKARLRACRGYRVLPHRVRLEIRQLHILQRGNVRRLQHHTWRAVRFERFHPARHAQAPMIPRMEPGKLILRVRRRKIIPPLPRKTQEVGGGFDTHRVQPVISRTCMTTAIAKKPGQRIKTARLKWAAENVRSVGHGLLG